MSPRDPSTRHASPWRRLVGEFDRLGWWALPLFVAVGLAGAVMAGALAVVYYSQQVGDLERETRTARREVAGTLEEVQQARDQALEEIRREVQAVEDALRSPAPVDDVEALGVVVIRALVNSAPPDAPPPAQQAPAGAPAEPTTPVDEPSPTPSSVSPSPTPTRPPVTPRLGAGFAVAVDSGQGFFATSYGLVADPDARAGVVEQVEVTLLDGTTVAGVVHSWDARRDIALVQAPTGAVPIGVWRPASETLEAGETLTIVGLTPDRQPVQVDVTPLYVAADALVVDVPDIAFLRGAPVVDRTGRVVAITTLGYRPYGAAAGDAQAIAPAAVLCESMLRGCEQLEGPPPDPPDAGG